MRIPGNRCGPRLIKCPDCKQFHKKGNRRSRSMNSGPAWNSNRQRPRNTHGIGGETWRGTLAIMRTRASQRCGGLAYTILRKLAKAAVAASYDVFCFSDGMQRGGSATTIEQDRTLAVSLRPSLPFARCASLAANRGRLPTICLFAPNAPRATLAGWLATSCFSWDFWLRR